MPRIIMAECKQEISTFNPVAAHGMDQWSSGNLELDKKVNWGADKFVDNSSLIAKKIGVSELTIGLTIVALGTSAPEIFVGISSVLNNSESIAMGTVVGSNISNIALIFGVSCIGISFLPKKTPIAQLMPFLVAALILGYVLIDLNVSEHCLVLLEHLCVYSEICFGKCSSCKDFFRTLRG